VTFAKRPSGRRDGATMNLIWVDREVKYFFTHDWTGGITLIRFNKFRFARNGDRSVASAKTSASRSGHAAAGLKQLDDLGQDADHRLAGDRGLVCTELRPRRRRRGVAKGFDRQRDPRQDRGIGKLGKLE